MTGNPEVPYDLRCDRLVAVGPVRVQVGMYEIAPAFLGEVGGAANRSLPPPAILINSTPKALSFSSLARAMVCGTTPVMLKPNACAPVAAPRAVFPIDGTISWRVSPSRRRWSSRCAAPRILKQPDGARNSHFA